MFFEFALGGFTIKKSMGIINDVIVLANRNYVPKYFIVLDIDCNRLVQFFLVDRFYALSVP